MKSNSMITKPSSAVSSSEQVSEPNVSCIKFKKSGTVELCDAELAESRLAAALARFKADKPELFQKFHRLEANSSRCISAEQMQFLRVNCPDAYKAAVSFNRVIGTLEKI